MRERIFFCDFSGSHRSGTGPGTVPACVDIYPMISGGPAVPPKGGVNTGTDRSKLLPWTPLSSLGLRGVGDPPGELRAGPAQDSENRQIGMPEPREPAPAFRRAEGGLPCPA